MGVRRRPRKEGFCGGWEGGGPSSCLGGSRAGRGRSLGGCRAVASGRWVAFGRISKEEFSQRGREAERRKGLLGFSLPLCLFVDSCLRACCTLPARCMDSPSGGKYESWAARCWTCWAWRGFPGGGRWPDCQRRRRSSRRAKMRAKMAAIRACSAAGSMMLPLSAVGAARRPANWSAKGECDSIRFILTNGYRISKGFLPGGCTFFWVGATEKRGSFALLRKTVFWGGKSPLRLPPPKRRGERSELTDEVFLLLFVHKKKGLLAFCGPRKESDGASLIRPTGVARWVGRRRAWRRRGTSGRGCW